MSCVVELVYSLSLLCKDIVHNRSNVKGVHIQACFGRSVTCLKSQARRHATAG